MTKRDVLGQAVVDHDLIITADGGVYVFCDRPASDRDIVRPVRTRATGDPGDLFESLFPTVVDIGAAIRVDVTLDDLWEHLDARSHAFGWSNNDLQHAAKLWYGGRIR